MRNRRHMCRSLPIIAVLLLGVGCGATPDQTRPHASVEEPGVEQAIQRGIGQFKAAKFAEAKKLFQQALELKLSPQNRILVMIYMARLTALEDAGKGSDDLLRLAQDVNVGIYQQDALLSLIHI